MFGAGALPYRLPNSARQARHDLFSRSLREPRQRHLLAAQRAQPLQRLLNPFGSTDPAVLVGRSGDGSVVRPFGFLRSPCRQDGVASPSGCFPGEGRALHGHAGGSEKGLGDGCQAPIARRNHSVGFLESGNRWAFLLYRWGHKCSRTISISWSLSRCEGWTKTEWSCDGDGQLALGTDLRNWQSRPADAKRSSGAESLVLQILQKSPDPPRRPRSFSFSRCAWQHENDRHRVRKAFGSVRRSASWAPASTKFRTS